MGVNYLWLPYSYEQYSVSTDNEYLRVILSQTNRYFRVGYKNVILPHFWETFCVETTTFSKFMKFYSRKSGFHSPLPVVDHLSRDSPMYTLVETKWVQM